MSDHVQKLADVANLINQVTANELLRPTLGEGSLESTFSNRFSEIKEDLSLKLRYAPHVRIDTVDSVRSYYQQIYAAIRAQSLLEINEFVAERDDFLNDVNGLLESIKRYEPEFVCAAIKEKGFLKDDRIRQEYETMSQSIEQETFRALNEIKDKSQSILEEAKEAAKEIEGRARLTASGISVETAQKQFKDAQKSMDSKTYLWAFISVIPAFGFVIVISLFLTDGVPDEWTWSILYYTAIRITLLTALGTAVAFCLNMFRAHLYMSERNRHRQRVANSIGAFVDSAVTREQRDLILSQLVDAVIRFDRSGLLRNESGGSLGSRTPVEAVIAKVPSDRPLDDS